MLNYANTNSTTNGNPVAASPTGASWYSQVKTKQGPAKDALDNINNQVANLAPSSCTPGF